MFLDRFGAFDGLADVVVPGPVCVLRTLRPSGAGLERFRCGCRAGLRGRADVAKPPPDAGGGEATRCGSSFPGPPEVLGEGPGETERNMRGDDQPGPQIGGVGAADLGCGPAEGLFHQPEGVLQVEAAEEMPATTGPRPPMWLSACSIFGAMFPQVGM